MKHQDKFKKKYGIDAIDFVEKADLEYFGLAKTIGIQSVLKSYAEKKGININLNDEFYKHLVEAFAEAGKKFPYNEKIRFDKDLYQLEPTPVNPSIPKSKGVLEDFKEIVADDPLRPQYNAVYVSENRFLYGTDAHKLIKYKNNDYSEYAGKLIDLKTFIASKGKKLDFIDAKPPQYDAVIPVNNPNIEKGLPTYNFYNLSKSVITLKKLQDSDIFSIIFDFKGELFGFNPVLMADVFYFALCKGFDTFTLEYSTPNRAMVFKFDKESLGLIMPIMLKEDSLLGTTPLTIEQVVSEYGSQKSAPKKAIKVEKTVKKEVKEVPYKKYEGSMENTSYVPRRDISYLVLRNGEQLSGNDIIDGVYKIKKMAKGGGVGESVKSYKYGFDTFIDVVGTNYGGKLVLGRGKVKGVENVYLSHIDWDDNNVPENSDEIEEYVNENLDNLLQNAQKYNNGGNVGNENAEMVMSYNKQIAHHTKEMNEAMSKKGEVPAWVVAKMTRSASDLSDATHFMEGKGEEYATGGGVGNDIYYGVIDSNNNLVFQSKNEREAKQVSYSYEGSIVKKYSGKGKIHQYAKGGAIGDNVHIMDEKSLMNNKSGVIIGDEGTFWLVKTLNGTGLVKKSKVKVIEDFATGGTLTNEELKRYNELNEKIESYLLGNAKISSKEMTEHAKLKHKMNMSKNPQYRKQMEWEKKTEQSGEYANGGSIGFIPMDLEEKLAITAKWGGTDIKGVIGILNAMIDSGLTDEDLKTKPTKTGSAFQKAIENKTKEIWAKIEPQYKGDFKGNMYYSTISRLVQRANAGDNILNRFKPFRKNQNFATGGGVGDKISEIKAKIEKAKANKIMPEALKKQYIEKYEKELAELEPKKEKSPKKETKKTTKVSKNYDYIPQRDIEQIKAKQGTVENKDILDGAYVKKGWKHKK